MQLPFQEPGWSRVEVGDDFFIGSGEGGFFGLEEYKPKGQKGISLPKVTD